MFLTLLHTPLPCLDTCVLEQRDVSVDAVTVSVDMSVVLHPVAYSAVALVGVLRYGLDVDLVNAEHVNTSINS
jgi:hypothetical protein